MILQWATWSLPFRFLNGLTSMGTNNPFHNVTHMAPLSEVDANLNKIKVWHFQEIAKLIDEMKKTPDGDGTLLDNTFIYWFSEWNHPAPHDPKDIPQFLAGGKNVLPASARGGQYRGRYIVRPALRPQNELLASLAHAMGLPAQKFGDAGNGPAPEIF